MNMPDCPSEHACIVFCWPCPCDPWRRSFSVSVWVLCRSSVSTPSAVTGWPGYRPSTTASRKLSGTTRCPPRGPPGERERERHTHWCLLPILCPPLLVHCPLYGTASLLPSSCHCWFGALFLPLSSFLVSFCHFGFVPFFLLLLVCYLLPAVVGLFPCFCHCWLVTPFSATVDLLSLFCHRWFVTPFLPWLVCYHVSAIVGLLPRFCHCWLLFAIVCYPLSPIVGLFPPFCYCWLVTLSAIAGLLPMFCHHWLVTPFGHCWCVTLFLPWLAFRMDFATALTLRFLWHCFGFKNK